MRFTYEDRSGSLYLELSTAGESRMVAKTYPCDPIEVGGIINLDFDKDGHLIGIEILGTTTLLRPSVLVDLRSSTTSDAPDEVR
jgi:uncharacterized protein YuzE